MLATPLPVLPRKMHRDAERSLERCEVYVTTVRPALALHADVPASNLHVFVGGSLFIDYQIRIDVTFSKWSQALQAGAEKVRHGWRVVGCAVGGFPAHATRAARAKGADVTLGAALPKKPPKVLERFLDDYRLRTAGTVTYDGAMPRTLELIFADSTHRLLIDAGPETPADAMVPRGDFDVILINPGVPHRRRPLLPCLRRIAELAPRTALGVVGRHDWGADDWNRLHGSGCHVFLNERELAASLGVTGSADPAHLLARLQPLANGLTVTATLGEKGALILHQGSNLIQIAAPAVRAKRHNGPGDAYCTTERLATALGRQPGPAGLIAAMDAGRWVSGQPHAASLEELEEEVRRRPEMAWRPVHLSTHAA